MAYTKTTWRTDDVITAALLNHMEQGIEDANNSGGGSGADGFSPVVTITDITGGHRVSIRDKTSTKTFDVMDGAAGATGATGPTGADGFSPTVTVTNITGGHRVAITDATGTKTFDVMDGSDSGGGSGGGDSGGRALIGTTPVTLTEDTSVELVATESTSYAYSIGNTAEFADRSNVVLTNATLSEGDGYYELVATDAATTWSESYASMQFGGLTVGEEYEVTITPQGSENDKISGGAYAFLDSTGATIKILQTAYNPEVFTFTATTETITLRLYPAGTYFWEREYRTARISNLVIKPAEAIEAAADFSQRKNVTLTGASLNVGDGYYEVAANSDVTAFNAAYASMVFDGLTVGKNYTITITPQGNTTDKISGGYYVFTDSNGGDLGELVLLNQVGTLDITATTESIRLRLYPANAYLWGEGYTSARLVDMVIMPKTSGTFNGTLSLGMLSAGTVITATPACQVYATGKQATGYQSRHVGKVCVCLGDSVTGFMAPPYDYPSVLAQETGMTVYNCGFAGCRISDTHPTTAYRYFGLTHIADGIASGDWTDQDANVSGIEAETYPQAHLANLKSINWNSVDFITIFYGANDAGNGVPFGDLTAKNIQTFIGAFNYSIERILTAYPRIKVLVLTPIYRYWINEDKGGDEIDITVYGTSDTKKYYEWGDALMERAKVYKIPAVDMFRTLGINSITRTTYLKNDGAHPTEAGDKLIGGKIAAKLLSEY